MFNLQTLTAQAEYNNKKALMDIEVALLTMKDDVYTKEIRKYRNLLVGFTYKSESTTNGETTTTTNSSYGALADLANAKSELMKAEVAEINYLSQNKYYLEELQLDKTHATKTLEIQQNLLKEYKALDATGTDSKALAEKLKGYKEDLQALDAKEDEAYTKIEEMRKPIFPINQQIIEEKIKLDAQSSAYTLAKADVDPALVSGLYSALSSEEGENALVEDLDKIFVEDAWDAELLKYQYTMKKDVVVKDLSLNEKATKIGVIANAIKAYYQGENSEAFDASGKLLDAYKAKFENELKRLEIDKKPAYAQFKADSITWIDAYVAYVGALKAYNNYKGANTYQAIKKEITTYNSLKAEDKKLETANTLRTSILGYLGKRKAVDGFNVEFATTYKDALTDANLATFNEAIATAVSDDISSLIGNEILATSFNAKAEGSTLSAFLEANQALFGGSTLNLKKASNLKKYQQINMICPKCFSVD